MKTIQDTDISTGIPVAVRFRAAAGSRFSAKDAERIGPELLRLKKIYGSLTKDVVVRSAKSAHSPLHKDFEWDDVKAAKAQRLEQARYLMRSIMIVWDESNAVGDTEEIAARLFHSVKATKDDTELVTSQGPKSVFVSLHDVMDNPEYATQVIETMEKALQRINTQFSFYLDTIPMFAERFQSVFDEIRSLEE